MLPRSKYWQRRQCRRFADRWDAGRLLGAHLRRLAGRQPLVLALPRGGVPVGAEVARALAAPLDVIVALKLGVPGQPELALGAVAPGIALVRREYVVSLEISDRYVETALAELRPEVEARTRLLRGDRPFPDLTGRAVVLVDDGLASGMTAAAAVVAIRANGAAEVLVAVPVASAEAFGRLEGADQVVALSVPAEFGTVGRWYADFRPIFDAGVLELLRQSASGAARHSGTVCRTAMDRRSGGQAVAKLTCHPELRSG